MHKVAKDAITEYRVNIQGVKEQFNGSIIEVDANKPEQKILEEIARILFLKESSAPRKPPKIILMGPPGVDTQEHAAQVAAKYRLINLDVDQLCKDWIRRRDANDDYATELRFKIIDGDQIPDDFVMNLVKQRLSMPDCKTNGWILQGAPTSDEQIEYLK
jgi:hypothetical protein